MVASTREARTDGKRTEPREPAESRERSPVALFVDDDSASLRAFETRARRHQNQLSPNRNRNLPPVEFLFAGNASEAITYLDDGDTPIDVLVSDIAMPDDSGLLLAEYALKARPAIATVLFSAVNSREYMLGAYQRGVNLYMTKPFDFERLVWAVHSVLASMARARAHWPDAASAVGGAITTVQQLDPEQLSLDEVFAVYMAVMNLTGRFEPEDRAELVDRFEAVVQAHRDYHPDTKPPWLRTQRASRQLQGGKKTYTYPSLAYYADDSGRKQRGSRVGDTDIEFVNRLLGES